MSKTAKTWTGIAIGGALLALALLAVTNRREIRDAWRVSRVKAHPDYSELKRRWQRIGRAIDELYWPAEPGRMDPLRKMLCRKLTDYEDWPGRRIFVDRLADLTEDVETRTRQDFGRTMVQRLARAIRLCKDTSLRELVAMREAGRISDGTFSRAMLILVRHEGCFLYSVGGSGRRPALQVLCDLLDDGEPRVARPRARNPEAAIADAAGSRTAQSLSDAWRSLLGKRDRIEGLKRLVELRTVADPLHEADAYESLARLVENTAMWRPPAARRRRPPGWPKRRPDLRWTAEFGDRSLLEAALRSEAARLPKEHRPPFYGVVDLVFFNQVSHSLGAEIKASGGGFSPTLRLISEIIRNNP